MNVTKNCETCEMNCGSVCMGGEYGMPISEAMKKHPNGCEDWELSFATWQDETEEQ